MSAALNVLAIKRPECNPAGIISLLSDFAMPPQDITDAIKILVYPPALAAGASAFICVPIGKYYVRRVLAKIQVRV